MKTNHRRLAMWAGLLLATTPAWAALPNGVSSGDVTQDAAVLWARSTTMGNLTFEWSTLPDFSVIDGSAIVYVNDTEQPAKVLVDALLPAMRYYYRATDAENATAEGTFLTAQPLGARTGLRFGATGDWQQAPPYPSLKNVPARDLAFFVKLGDTIYADTETPALPGVVQARTLAQFRIKHSEVYSERPEAPGFNFMLDLNASTAILATTDDHELVDNFAGGAAPGDSPDAPDVHPSEPPMFIEDVPYVNQTQAYADAYQAYREYHPLRLEDWYTPADPRTHERPKLYRYNTYGSDAAVIMLDSRSFRDAQLPPVSDPTDPVAVAQFVAATYTPGRTLLGRVQVDQLKADLLRAQQDGITWKFVTIPEPIQNFGPLNAEDRFEGYAFERDEILRFIDENGIKNVVFMAGDFHGTLVNNLTYLDMGTGTQKATGAIEIVTGPAAFYSGLFGPAVINIALAVGFITPEQYAYYQSLPVAPDADSFPNDKDDFLKGIINGQTGLLGYDPMGLNDNLPQAEGRFDATLLAGDYVSAHLYTWAEYEIDPVSQQLLVTLWSIPAYSEADFLADPAAIIALEPELVCQFVLNPQFESGDLNCDGAVDFRDVNPFVLALGDPAAYAAAYPDCNLMNADINGDGVVDFRDINPFVVLLTGQPEVAFYLTVLHHNDGESQLIDAGGDLSDYGGIARFKTLVDQLKAEALVDPGDGIERGYVLLSSGDNFLAGPEFSASLATGVPYYDAIGLDLIGYDGFTLGNHDFDFGPDVLEDFVNSFTLTQPPFLSANLDFALEPGLQALVDSGRIASSTLIPVGSMMVGVIGATTPALPYISSPRDVIVDPDVLGAVQAEVVTLKDAGADIIILSSHLQSIFEEWALTPYLSDVDIIIAGGGGELLANPTDLLVPGDSAWPTYLGGYGYPRIATDALGYDLPIITTEGDYRYVGRLLVGFDAAGRIVEICDLSGPVRVSGVGEDAVSPNPDVQAQVVDPVVAFVADLDAEVIGTSEVDLDGIRAHVRTEETNLGNLCADSLLWTGQQLAGEFGAPLPDIALQNGGGIRNNAIIPAGDITALDTFDVLPFPNFVTIVEAIPPAQFKEIMENCVSAVEFTNGRFGQIAGFALVYDPTGTPQELDGAGEVVVPGTRVIAITLDGGTPIVADGEVVAGAPSVHVATIDFLARGGDQYPFRSAPFTSLGVSYQQALSNYIQDGLTGLITAADYPAGGEGRITTIP